MTDTINPNASATPIPTSAPRLDDAKRDPIMMDPKASLPPKPAFANPFTPKPKDPHLENLKVLRDKFGEDRIKEFEPMDKHTTFRIGGPAEFYFEAETIEELISIIAFTHEDLFLKKPEDVTEADRIRYAEKEKNKPADTKPKSPFGLNFGAGAKKEPKYQMPLFILGGGSNLLVSDRGIPGLTVKIKANKVNIGGDLVEAYAGTLTAVLLHNTLEKDLTGMEFLDGVPGTIGGAIVNNAKAFYTGSFLPAPKSISDILYDLTVMSKDGKVSIRSKRDYEWSLTHNNISDTGDIILVVRIKLKKGRSEESKKYLEEYKARRKEKPYMRYPTAGSVFRNPESESAGKLIDQCGLKGTQVGGAQISPEHGNIFINLGQAKAKDIRDLIDLCKTKVKEKFSIDLHEEIKYIGDFRTEQEIAALKAKLETENTAEQIAPKEPLLEG